MSNRIFLPILFLTLGWLGIEMSMALDVSQFQIILDRHLDNARKIAAVLSLGPIAGVTVQPLTGWAGDVLFRYGLSRKILILTGLGLGSISIIGLSLVEELWAIVLLIALFFLGFNILIVSYRAIVTEISTRKALSSFRGTISGYIALFSGLGGCILFIMGQYLSGSPWLFWLTTLLLLTTFAVFFRFAPKSRLNQRHHETPCNDELFQGWKLFFYAMPFLGMFPSLESKFSNRFHQIQIFRLFVVVFFAWIGIQALRGFFVLYVDKVLHLGHGNAHLFLAVITLSLVVTAVPLGKLADRLNNVMLLRYALLLFALVSGVGFLINGWWACFGVSVLMGVSIAGMVVYPMSMLMKLCPPRIEGSYAGLYNLFISIPQLYSLLITGWLIDLFQDYRVIFPIAAVTLLFGCIMTFRMTPLHGNLIAKPITEETPRYDVPL